MPHGASEVLPLLDDVSEIVVRLDEIGLQLNCLGVTRDRLFEAVQSLQEMTVIVVRFGKVRMGFVIQRVIQLNASLTVEIGYRKNPLATVFI